MPVEGLIRFDGADNDEYMFSTDSWSGTGEEYVITISKRTGVVSCTCMDAVCRHKQCRIDDEDGGCKHIRAVRRWIDQLAPGAIASIAQLTGEQT